MRKLRVLVTGATGLVGYHTVKYLIGRGHEVVAVVRKSSRVDALEDLPDPAPVIAVAELWEREALVKAMTGADVVVHAAGCVDPLGRRAEIMSVNVEGTRACLEAAAAAGVKQFIHISSLSVITGQGDQFNVDESAPRRLCGEAYADSKVEAEELVMAEAKAGRIKITVLRPGFIYGPGERAWMPRLINSLATGKAMLIDGGAKETNVIYVGNLTRAIEASLFNAQAYGQVYNLTDGERVTKKHLFDAICDELGLPRVTRTVPGFVAKAVCEAVSTVAPTLPVEMQRKLSRYSRAAFRLAGVNQGFAIDKAERELGYTNRIPFAQGIKETLAHFRKLSPTQSGNDDPAPADAAAKAHNRSA